MPHNEKPFNGYKDGAEMWRDNVMSYGIDEARVIARNYLDMNLKREMPPKEDEFCCEIFTAMFEATAGRADPKKLVYPYDFNIAYERMESSHYHASRKFNNKCAVGIDRLINDSCYKTYSYNPDIAAMLAVLDYGFPRVCSVLAFNIQRKTSDGRISAANRKWADGFIVQEKAFDSAWLNSHSTLIDGFCRHIRELYRNTGAERFNLPGDEGHGESVKDYAIKRAITTSTTYDNGEPFSTGYAIGHNPEAVNPWCCWQFAVRDGEKHYNWGVYCDDEQTAVDSYIARVFVALNREEMNGNG